MKNKRILALNGHPAKNSLSDGLLSSYLQGAADAGHDIRRHDLATMDFDPDFGTTGYDELKPLEKDLENFLSDLEWSEHIVIVTPLWWGGVPSKLKGLFDRALLPGRAFDPRIKKAGLPKPLLTGKTAHTLMTSDTPNWAFSLLYNSAARKQIERQILKFVGIKPTHFSNFAPALTSDKATIDKWLATAQMLGRKPV